MQFMNMAIGRLLANWRVGVAKAQSREASLEDAVTKRESLGCVVTIARLGCNCALQ